MALFTNTGRLGEFPNAHRTAMMLVASASLAILVALIFFFDPDCGAETAEVGGETVFDCVEVLPMSRWFYVAIALIAGCYGVWRWRWRKRVLQETDELLNDSPLHDGDRSVVYALRARALSSRTLVGILLAGVVASLFVGLYVSIYVSPHVRGHDIRVADMGRYGDQIDALKSGEYWLFDKRVEASAESVVVDGKRFQPERTNLREYWELMAHKTGGSRWRFDAEPKMLGRFDGKNKKVEITAIEYHDDGQSAIVGTKDGTLYLTIDGGNAWNELEVSPLKATDWVVGGLVAEGSLVVVSNNGNVFLRDVPDRDDQAAHRQATQIGSADGKDDLQRGEQEDPAAWREVENWMVEVTAAEFDKGGEVGVVGTSDGKLHSTSDGGKSWRTVTRDDLGLGSEEWVDRAVVAADGPWVIHGNGGSVSVRTKYGSDEKYSSAEDQWESPGDWLAPSSVTAVEFHKDGQQGVVGTRNGSLHWTRDGGETWETWTRGHLGLASNEWVIEAVVAADGPRLVVGNRTSERVYIGDEWTPLDFAAVRIVEFDEQATKGVIGTRDGALYSTDDGGLSWPKTWGSSALGLNSGEWVDEAVVTTDGPQLIVGNKGSVKVLTEGGWNSPDDLDTTAGVVAVEFHGDGDQGVIGTRDGALYSTADGGRSWQTKWRRVDLGLNPTEWVDEAVVSTDGPQLVVGDEGSVKVLKEGRWIPPVDLNIAADIMVVEFHGDGDQGVIGTRDGTLYSTADGGRSWRTKWERLDLGLNSQEWVKRAVVDSNGVHLIVGDDVAVRTLAEDREEWIPANIWNVLNARFRPGSQHGFIETRDGALYVTTDRATTWARAPRGESGLEAKEWVGAVTDGRLRDFQADQEGIKVRTGDEWILPEAKNVVTAARRDGDRALIATSDGALHLTVDGGDTWTKETRDQLGLKGAEWIVDAVIADEGRWVVVGDRGTVRVGDDGEWDRPRLPGSGTDGVLFAGKKSAMLVNVVNTVRSAGEGNQLMLADGVAWFWNDRTKIWANLGIGFNPGETAAAIALDEDVPIVLGTEGTVSIGQVPRPPYGELPRSMDPEDISIASLDDTLVVAIREDTDAGEEKLAIYYRKKHNVDNISELVDSLPEESQLRQRMAVALEKAKLSTMEEFGIDQTFWMRFATIAATIYFVQLLVRFCQYSFRLAAFWDSRADAVLLGHSFSDSSKPQFDSLVTVMGSDSVDFKAPRFSYWPTWRHPSRDAD